MTSPNPGARVVPSIPLSNDEAVAFLTVCADYFERRPTDGGDAAHWSNVSNGRMCRKIAAMLSAAKPPAIGVDAVAVIEQISPSTFYRQKEVGDLHGWCERTREALRSALSPAATSGSEAGGEAVTAALEAADAVLTGEDACALDPIVGSDNPHEHAAGLVREALRVREATRPHPTDPGHWRWRGE